jgi:hypothetical protein
MARQQTQSSKDNDPGCHVWAVWSISILKNVIQSKMKQLNRPYLTIEHEGEEF